MSNTEETKPKNNAKPEPLGVFYVRAKKDYRKEIKWLEKQSKNNSDKLKDFQNKKFYLGRTPDILQLLGAENVNVVMFHSVQWKAMAVYLNLPPLVSKNGDEKTRHNIPPETMIELPNALNNPIAVFKSKNPRNGEDAFLVLTDLKEPEDDHFKQIAVALHYELNDKGEKELHIKSAYGRSENQLEKGFLNDLMYINREKALILANEYGGKVENAILNTVQHIKTNSNMQVPWWASIAAVSDNCCQPKQNSHITVNQNKTNGDLQVPWRASIAAVPDNCCQPRQNLFVAVREYDNTPFVHKLQEKLKKFISQTIDMVKNIFNKSNNTQATPPQNNQAYNENDLRQWRMENAPLEKDKAYQVFMSIYAERIPPYTPAYEEIAHSTKQEVEEKYKQGKNCTLKQLGEFRQDFFKAFDKSRIKVRQEMDRELKQTQNTLPENITQQNQDDSIKNTTQNNSGCLKR
ncbi:MAG: hypothetical protein IJR44_00605 [Neisseriaceae bacterium]|nr:hypothetical protein [Neisseriaceae bacterium]